MKMEFNQVLCLKCRKVHWIQKGLHWKNCKFCGYPSNKLIKVVKDTPENLRKFHGHFFVFLKKEEEKLDDTVEGFVMYGERE